MDRRGFLSNAMTLGAGAAAVPMIGCAPALGGARVATLTDAEADDAVARLRRSLDAADAARVVSPLVPEAKLAEDAELRAHAERGDALARKAVRALILADAGRVASNGAAPPEALARCFEAHAPELDDAVIAHTALLARAPVRERRLVGEALRRDPDAAMRIGEALDGHSRALGVSGDGRGKMRRILAEVSARSRAQSFSAVVDDYVGKVHRVAALRGQDAALARAIATQASGDALWSTAPLAVATTPAAPAGRAAPQGPRPGEGVMRAGGITAGIGVAVLGIGLLGAFTASDLNIGFAVVATVGAVVLLVGLVMVLVGVIVRASS